MVLQYKVSALWRVTCNVAQSPDSLDNNRQTYWASMKGSNTLQDKLHLELELLATDDACAA